MDGLHAIHIELGVNVTLIVFGGPKPIDKWTWALVSFVLAIPQVRFAPQEYDTLQECLGDAWFKLVLSPNSPMVMKGVGGQEGWRGFLRQLYGAGFVNVGHALRHGEDMPPGAEVINIAEWLAARGIDADQF